MARPPQHVLPALLSGRSSRIGFLLVLSIAIAGPVSAEIFKWMDEAGRLHFAQDLSQVPTRFRSQAAGGAIQEGEGNVIQHYEPSPASLRTRRPDRRTGRAGRSKPFYRIRVQKAGSTMKVNVRLNDEVTAPFYIDTGASDVLLPAWVARELGLDLEGARTGYYGTANGVVQQSLVTLDSVDLGGARAEHVPASVSETMSVGLLGLSFFNHFEYRVDPGAGVVTLRPNGLVEAGRIRGGRSADQWKAEFRRIAERRRAIERTLEEINPNWARRRAELNEALEEVDRQRRLLEGEADDAHVPMQWRD